VATRPLSELDQAGIIRLMVGRDLSAVFPKRPVPQGRPVVELRGFGCRASGVQGIDLVVHAGEIVGLAGLVGSGRTELARAVFGLTPADEGELRLRDRPARIGSPSDAVALGIAYVPEDRRRHAVIQELPVAANLTLAVLRAISRAGWLDRARERSVAAALVERLGVKAASLDVAVATLSGGNQQKVALGRWVAAAPALLILDEPTQGIDVGAKAEVHRLMVELAERGLAVLMISSDLPEVLGMSDRVAVMRQGTLAGVLARSEATPETVMALALGTGTPESATASSAAPASEGRSAAAEAGRGR
jgi:rhamnose transport system ATP-binding protein